MSFFTEIGGKNHLKIHKETQKTADTQSNPARSIIIPDLKQYYKAITTKPAWYWNK